MRVTFFELLVNPLEGSFFGKWNKLDELYNYFTSPNDEVKINKARSKESGSIYMGFK